MVQSPSWEANWFAASQEIPRISRNPMVHYRTHKRPPPVPILCQPNPVHILTYLLTHSMVQSPSWEANRFAASQQIHRISRKPKVHYRTHKRPPPVPILGQPNPVHVLTYLLTPWCRVLLEKPTGLQLVKKFPAFHGTRMFITALTSVRHLQNKHPAYECFLWKFLHRGFVSTSRNPQAGGLRL